MLRRFSQLFRWLTILAMLVASLSLTQDVLAQEPSLELSPTHGPAGTAVQVTGSGFPENSTIVVGPGVYATEPVSSEEVETNDDGEFVTEVTIPTTANPNERWVIMANPLDITGPSILADFNVTEDAETEIYIVQSGDTLSEIARMFDTSLRALIRANPQIENPNRIYPGDEIVIPGAVVTLPDTGERVYVVESGDTLSEIAVRFNRTVEEMVEANPEIEDPSRIFPGQRLVIPEETPEDPREDQEEPIMILEPGPDSRVLSPVTIRGEADPTHEQHLEIRIYAEDGTLLAESSATIDATLGERGPFETKVEFEVNGEANAFIQVFSRSARDVGITHLSSVGVTLASDGEENINTREPYVQRIVTISPEAQTRQTISGGTVHVEGFGLASFEQTLIIEVQDESGEVVGQSPTIVEAPDLGEPGPFEEEVEYEIDTPQPGRIVVRDPSPAFGGDVYLTSVEVQLEP